MFKKLIVFALNFISINTFAQQIIPLYPAGKIPNANTQASLETYTTSQGNYTSYAKVSVPTLTMFLPAKDKANGGAIIICPGGGYGRLAFTHEGTQIAESFAALGYTAFVLKYRLPFDSIQPNKSIAPLQDAQRAIKLVRQRAKEWNIDTAKVGIIGFSAGGHLAASTITHFDSSFTENKENINLRPSFAILGYPVISFQDSLTHAGSKMNLIGKNPSKEQTDFYSNELQVKANTPPTFLFHAQDDKAVKVENSLLFYMALTKNKVPAEMLLFPGGGHGFGLINKTTEERWLDRVVSWMKASKFL